MKPLSRNYVLILFRFLLKVAVNQAGISRGFAFVDYMTAEEAEKGQKSHNGALLEETNIRVAYGTPGRTGASILGGHHPTLVCGMIHCMPQLNLMHC